MNVQKGNRKEKEEEKEKDFNFLHRTDDVVNSAKIPKCQQ